MQLWTQKQVKEQTGAERAGWIQALQSEVDSISNMQVIERITYKDVRRMEAETGIKVDVLPSKIVWAEKPAEEAGSSKEKTPQQPGAARKKKARVVVCGNYQDKKAEEVYTNLMDASGLRVMTKVAAQKGWCLGKLDISTAFLNAALDGVVVCKPPQFLIQQGMASETELWLLRRALYGLRVAPRAWEKERDDKMKKTSWTSEGRTFWYEQTASDASIWRRLVNHRL